jgi:hypothetical protein
MDPTIFTPAVMLALIAALSTIALAMITQVGLQIGNYFKMRAIQTQQTQLSKQIAENTEVTAVAANAGIETKSIVLKQGEAIAPAAKDLQHVLEQKTAEIKQAITEATK